MKAKDLLSYEKVVFNKSNTLLTINTVTNKTVFHKCKSYDVAKVVLYCFSFPLLAPPLFSTPNGLTGLRGVAGDTGGRKVGVGPWTDLPPSRTVTPGRGSIVSICKITIIIFQIQTFRTHVYYV